MKKLLTLFTVVVLSTRIASASEPHELTSLNDYIAHALSNSSTLRAAYADFQAAMKLKPQATALPNPIVSYGYFIDSVETRVGPQEHKIGIAQSFPWFGTLAVRGAVADHQAQAEFNRFLSKKNVLVFELSKTYTELAYVDAVLEVTKESIKLGKMSYKSAFAPVPAHTVT